MRRLRVPWAVFAQQARPIIAAYYADHDRCPYTTELRQQGFGWLISAASKHYGGYRRVVRLFGFSPPPRPLLHLKGCRPHGYWADERNIKRELRLAFPELIAWDTMPSIRQISRVLPGLESRILKHSKLRVMAKSLGLLPFWAGNRARRRVEGIREVLTFYQMHGRWPLARECSHDVRCVRFVRGKSWHDYCRPLGLPPSGLYRLIAIVERHIQWLQDNNKAHKALVRRRVLNWLIIQRVKRFPLLP